MKNQKQLEEAHEMGVEELISAAGTLHQALDRPASDPDAEVIETHTLSQSQGYGYAHRCNECGRLISVLAQKET